MTGRTRVMAGLLLATTFAVGNFTGMALEEALGIDWFDFLDEDSGEGSEELLAGLDLSSEQRAQAERILEREEDRLEDYWESRLPEIRDIIRQTYAEMREILTPAQREIFDRRVRELGSRLPAESHD